MKINYALISRVLIALLFVVAGIGKVTGFSGTVAYIGSLGAPLPTVATLIAILVEIPVALAFAYGYRTKVTGYILIGFTAFATILAHRQWSATDPTNMIMALKNIAIIGGIMAAVKCTCDCNSCKDCKITK